MKLLTYSHQGVQEVGVIASDPQKVVPVRALGFSAQDMNEFIRQLDGRSPQNLQPRRTPLRACPCPTAVCWPPFPNPDRT